LKILKKFLLQTVVLNFNTTIIIFVDIKISAPYTRKLEFELKHLANLIHEKNR